MNSFIPCLVSAEARSLSLMQVLTFFLSSKGKSPTFVPTKNSPSTGPSDAETMRLCIGAGRMATAIFEFGYFFGVFSSSVIKCKEKGKTLKPQKRNQKRNPKRREVNQGYPKAPHSSRTMCYSDSKIPRATSPFFALLRLFGKKRERDDTDFPAARPQEKLL